MKLWKAFVNNGDWNGARTMFALAETEEEAYKKLDLERHKNWGYEVYGPREATGEDILSELGIFNKEYELTYSLQEKSCKSNT